MYKRQVSASLTPQANGLQLRLLGGLFVNNTWAFIFEYKITLTLVPLNGTDPNQLLTVQAPPAGALNLAWYGTPPPGGDAIKTFITGGMEPQLRTQVLAQARPLVNDAVRLNHDVVWWTEQGFTMSVRKVAYSTSALTVYGALCRLG